MSIEEGKKKVTRKDFMKVVWGTLGGLVALEISGVALAYMQPQLGDGEFGGLIEVGEVDVFCSVPWDQVQEKFICPCHNSQFTTDGDVLNPPAPRALDMFPVIIEGEIIKVDTSRPISRQVTDPSQIVYP
jgi:cytochrome b6-f complex iron-sulfur subunit